MSVRSKIIGTGSYLPEKVVKNTDFTDIETSDEWIRERSGIETRHFSAKGETTGDMAVKAGLDALKDAGLKPEDIDAVIVATTTPDFSTPGTSAKVQGLLGIKKGFAFDIQAACSGFVYGVSIADAMIRVGNAKRVLLIGAETLTSITDFKDRSTCVLFGDGAGAVILEATEEKEVGVIDTLLRADGSLLDLLKADGGVSSTGTAGVIKMAGREVFKHAVVNLAAIADEILKKNGLEGKDVNWFIPHQANKRIITATAERLGMPLERVVITVDHHANTSSASIPLAFDEARKSGKIKKGDLVLIDAMGAGMTWAAALIKM